LAAWRATVRARETCILLEVKGAELRRLGEAHPDVEFNVLLKVSERLRNDNEQILALHLKDADGASRAKDEFLAMLGHELRNPLGAISAAIHVLDAESNPGDDTARLRQIITHQTGHLSRLVEDLGTLAHTEGGTLTLQKAPTDIGVLLEDVAVSLQPEADARDVAIQVTAPAGLPLVDVDAVRLREVMFNLISNALRYSPAGQAITVDAAIDDRTISIQVRDRGPGIPAIDLPHIFERFHKGASSTGSGLGLTIAHNLVAAHGGTLRAESGEGEGTAMTVVIPLTRD